MEFVGTEEEGPSVALTFACFNRINLLSSHWPPPATDRNFLDDVDHPISTQKPYHDEYDTDFLGPMEECA